ncbi:MAG: alpha/beta hydrolase family protein [Candidatus Helarchaeota archaeon]
MRQDQIYNIESMDIPNFWNLSEIESIPLNITIEKTGNIWNETYQKNFTFQNIYYTSQYWNNSPLRIYGVLIFPDNHSGNLTKVPGILLMHGLGGNHTKMLDLAYILAAQNYSVLVIDMAGHGLSDGPYPTQEWIIPNTDDPSNITSDLLNQTHFYLVTRAALRGVDVLLNQSIIDQNRIVVMGGSYGGITSIFVSNIYWMKVRTAIPIIAAGNFKVSFATQYSLFRLLVNVNEIGINSPSFSYIFENFDPINYVNSSNNPPTLYICSTNDDFFPIVTFNNTYYESYNLSKGISMTPGGHHGIQMYPIKGTILYWLNYTLWNGPAPPKIHVNKEIIPTIFGSKIKINANISCNASISKVILATHREVMGAFWIEHDMTRLDHSIWSIELSNLPINAELTYYVIVELDNQYFIMFSSYVYRESLSTWLEIPFIIMLIFIFALPIFLLIRMEINKKLPKVASYNQRKLLYLYCSQIAGMGTSELFILFSLFLPLVVVFPQSNNYSISMETILTQFIDFVPILTLIIYIILTLGLILSISKPILGGLINLIIPVFLIIGVILAVSWLSSIGIPIGSIGLSEESIIIGFGLILWLIMPIIQIGFGIFKRIYQKRLLNSDLKDF